MRPVLISRNEIKRNSSTFALPLLLFLHSKFNFSFKFESSFISCSIVLFPLCLLQLSLFFKLSFLFDSLSFQLLFISLQFSFSILSVFLLLQVVLLSSTGLLKSVLLKLLFSFYSGSLKSDFFLRNKSHLFVSRH